MRRTKTERVQMLVHVKIEYETQAGRREALKDARESLFCRVYSSGGDGSYRVESGRVILRAQEGLKP